MGRSSELGIRKYNDPVCSEFTAKQCIYLGVVFAFTYSVSAFITVGNLDLQDFFFFFVFVGGGGGGGGVCVCGGVVVFLRVLYMSTTCCPPQFVQQRLTPGSQCNPPPPPRVIITGRPKVVLLLRFHFLNVLILTILCVKIFKDLLPCW